MKIGQNVPALIHDKARAQCPAPHFAARLFHRSTKKPFKKIKGIFKGLTPEGLASTSRLFLNDRFSINIYHRRRQPFRGRSEEHTSELQSLDHLVLRLL